EDDVAGMVGAAVREGIDVVEGRGLEVEHGGAVDAAPAAVAHGSAFDCAFVTSSPKVLHGAPGAALEAGDAGEAGEHDVVMPTAGHFTSRERLTPHDGRNSHRGASEEQASDELVSCSVTHRSRHDRTRRYRRLCDRR